MTFQRILSATFTILFTSIHVFPMDGYQGPFEEYCRLNIPSIYTDCFKKILSIKFLNDLDLGLPIPEILHHVQCVSNCDDIKSLLLGSCCSGVVQKIFAPQIFQMLQVTDASIEDYDLIDDDHILVCTSDGSAQMRNIRTGECLMEFKGHGEEISVLYLIDDDLFITGAFDNTARIFYYDRYKKVPACATQEVCDEELVVAFDNMGVED